MKRMVWIVIILAILAATVLAFFISRNRWTTLPTGGERKDHTDPNAPKVIESTEIVEFHCEFSTLTLVGAEKLRRGVYSLDAVSGENAVSGAAVYAFAQKKISKSTQDLVAGESALADNEVYYCYE